MSEASQGTPIAEFTDYDGLRRALCAAREWRNISLEDLDTFGGGPTGGFGKILGPRAVRRLGLQSLGWALGGLGLRAVLVEDPEAWERIRKRRDFKTRDQAHLASATQMHAPALQITFSRKKMAAMSRKGGIASWAKLTPKQRTRKARKMAKARWRKVSKRRKS
jgi:hypothetical protein